MVRRGGGLLAGEQSTTSSMGGPSSVADVPMAGFFVFSRRPTGMGNLVTFGGGASFDYFDYFDLEN